MYFLMYTITSKFYKIFFLTISSVALCQIGHCPRTYLIEVSPLQDITPGHIIREEWQITSVLTFFSLPLQQTMTSYETQCM